MNWSPIQSQNDTSLLKEWVGPGEQVAACYSSSFR